MMTCKLGSSFASWNIEMSWTTSVSTLRSLWIRWLRTSIVTMGYVFTGPAHQARCALDLLFYTDPGGDDLLAETYIQFLCHGRIIFCGV